MRVDAGLGNRRLRRLQTKMRRELAFSGNMALFDAGALDDPLIRRIDLFCQFGIGDDALRQIRAIAKDDRTHRSHETASCALGTSASEWPSRLSV